MAKRDAIKGAQLALVCGHCGGQLPRLGRARFCSDACRQAAKRRRDLGLPESLGKRPGRFHLRRLAG